MSEYLVVKLGAAGDVLLTTALTRALRQSPRASCPTWVAWLTYEAMLPLLESNPDIDEQLALKPAAGAREMADCLRRWRHAHPKGTILLLHRSRRMQALAWLTGFRRVLRCDPTERPSVNGHRLHRQAVLLAKLGVANVEVSQLRPRLELTPQERAEGEAVWFPSRGERWAIAPGGAANNWATMPQRRWARERFVELGARALGADIAVRWLGGSEDRALTNWICSQLGTPRDNYAGRLSLRQSAAVAGAADRVIGNDSLPLVMAHALGSRSFGLYGPTAGELIHAPGEDYLQGRVGCGPCYQPQSGTRGRAYRCPRARCMESISVNAVWEANHV
ncbi:MAG TPA: glycosyltransferase family 9 protein [Terriglobales bacterium]|nr:glycosyltransferase family 9 protein [Terriglobales bacterium]